MVQDSKAPKAPAVETPVDVSKLPARASVRAVFGGPMVNPLTEDRFAGEPSKPVDIDGWLKIQIEAGKIEIVE